jgi:hypothetical protein
MIHSWSSTAGNGNPSYSEILRDCAGVDKKLAGLVFVYQ